MIYLPFRRGAGITAAAGLANTGLQVRCFLNEATSGTTPTHALDKSGVGTATDLTLTYGTALNYITTLGNRGLQFTSITGTQRAEFVINDASGDKIRDSVHGGQKFTLEYVISITTWHGNNCRLWAINERNGDAPSLGYIGNAAANQRFYFNEVLIESWAAIQDELAIYHIVVDTTQATAANRVKIYKNGSIHASTDSATITQNATLSIPTSSSLYIGNRESTGSFDRSFDGEIYYAAIYNAALSEAEITNNYDILVVDDDDDEDFGEFNIIGATYFAVAPSGYSYSAEQTTNYSTRKYTTLSAAEAGLAASPSTPQIINIIGEWSSDDTAAVTWSGTSTTAANYILVRAIGSARHNGIPKGASGATGKSYRLRSTTGHVNTVSNQYITFFGIEVEQGSTGTSDEAFRVTVDNITWNACVITAGSNSSQQDGIYSLNLAFTKHIVTNCLFKDFGRSGIHIQNQTLVVTSGGYYANNTMINCGQFVDIADAGSIIVQNNHASGTVSITIYNILSYGPSATPTNRSDLQRYGTTQAGITFTGSNNFTRDGSFNESNLTGGAQKTLLTDLDFVDEPNEDYHIQTTSDAKDAGSDRSADADHPKTDIDGDTRSGTWDIGMHEF